jgi:Ran GTPase-activating protein (RanGAP) involved in mRNA processing and transport
VQLSAFRALACLDLSSNHLSSHAVDRLARRLCCATALHTLRLQWSVRANSMHSLAEGLRKCSGLTSLTLGFNLVNNDRFARYALRLQHCRRVQLLDFTGNLIRSAGAQAFARCLQHFAALQQLLLPHNAVGCQGAAALLQHSAECPTLTALDLSSNVLCSIIPAHVASAVHRFFSPRLLELPDPPPGFEALLAAAAHATALRRLDLADNRMTDAEKRSLAARWGPGRPGLTLESAA